MAPADKFIVVPFVERKLEMVNVDWKLAPKNARWWAVDANGEAHWFCEPDISGFTDFWFSESISAPSFSFNGDWRTSLTERPSRFGLIK
ncbi:hypothetical protein G6K87_20355 [Agrobacterium tumefaciens]